LWGNLNGGKLLDHQEAEVRASHDRWRGEAGTRKPAGGGLEEALLPQEFHKLLGVRFAG
jgi:hypothetical protein